ncbi:MHS family MFS transporter, partial [Bacteroides thetaiotaomicron]|nr:MHS family MFS transporter [Bacteroides thetaiotaomicron]
RKRTVKLPLRDVVRDHWVVVLLAAGTLPVINVTYFRSTFALSWATKELGYAQGTFLGILSISLVVQFLMQPIGAWFVSKVDMRRAMCWIL